jgi:bacterioferritin (cytochrome b1)
MAKETMDVDQQIECLNRALRLQHRSVLHYSLVAGSVIGLEYQAHAEKMGEHAASELEDATRLVEKIAALGGEPTTDRVRGGDARGAPGGDRAHRPRGRFRGR